MIDKTKAEGCRLLGFTSVRALRRKIQLPTPNLPEGGFPYFYKGAQESHRDLGRQLRQLKLYPLIEAIRESEEDKRRRAHTEVQLEYCACAFGAMLSPEFRLSVIPISSLMRYSFSMSEREILVA
jgi:hypothetical protein